ncbi:MAG: hypothetical protein VKO21_03390 [Candidatus Sericytochromatia bacterium]|nr:hypothetical protein [Candidatus Sericytochromatia bacterium]
MCRRSRELLSDLDHPEAPHRWQLVGLTPGVATVRLSSVRLTSEGLPLIRDLSVEVEAWGRVDIWVD